MLIKVMEVKFDPDTKFKWPVFAPKTPLTLAEDKVFKDQFQVRYLDVINNLLAIFKLAPCSGQIRMLTSVYVGNKQYDDTPIFGTYKPDIELSEKISKNTSLTEDENLNVQNVFVSSGIEYRFLTDKGKSIEQVKQKFKQCANESLFVVGLQLTPVYIAKPGTRITTHANILVISKSRGVVYWIEPQTTVNPVYEKKMIQAIKTLVSEIGMVDPTVINPVEVCPQAVANDANCMFWSYLLFFLIMLNPSERDHNGLVKQYMKKYPDKESLTKQIDSMKALFNEQLKAFTGANRSTLKRKQRKLKRKTYKRRLL